MTEKKLVDEKTTEKHYEITGDAEQAGTQPAAEKQTPDRSDAASEGAKTDGNQSGNSDSNGNEGNSDSGNKSE